MKQINQKTPHACMHTYTGHNIRTNKNTRFPLMAVLLVVVFQLLVCLLGLPRAMLPSCLFVWCGVPLLFCFMCLCVLWSVVCPSQFLVSWCDFWYVACAFCISMLVLFVD